MRRAYSYLRFSSHGQAKGDSLARQLERSAAWCSRHEYYLDDSLSLRDLGRSGFHGSNVEVGRLGAFLKACEEGRVKAGSVLLIENLDRLTRQHVSDALELFLSILRHGVDIVTTHPSEFRYSRKTLDQTQLVIAIVELSRGNAESARKKDFADRAWTAWRKKIAAGEPVTGKCPLWMRLDRTKGKFVLIPERAKVVRLIFDLCISGLGRPAIAKKLNRDGVPTFGRAKLWSDRLVGVVLDSRATYGEFRPHRYVHDAAERAKLAAEGKMTDRMRTPVGDPVAGYYPAAIDEQTFFAAKAALASRVKKAGRRSKLVANLFVGILRDARDGSTFRVTSKTRSGDKYLVNSSAMRGAGGEYVTFPISGFERGFLSAVTELRTGDLLGSGEGLDLDDQIAALEQKLADTDAMIAQASARRDAGNFAAILDLLAKLQGERDGLAVEVEKLRAERHYSASDSLRECQDLIEALETRKGVDLAELRERLRHAIALLVTSITVYVRKVDSRTRVAYAEIAFRQGGRRLLAITSRQGVARGQSRGVEFKSVALDDSATFANLPASSIVPALETLATLAGGPVPPALKLVGRATPKPTRAKVTVRDLPNGGVLVTPPKRKAR